MTDKILGNAHINLLVNILQMSLPVISMDKLEAAAMDTAKSNNYFIDSDEDDETMSEEIYIMIFYCCSF